MNRKEINVRYYQENKKKLKENERNKYQENKKMTNNKYTEKLNNTGDYYNANRETYREVYFKKIINNLETGGLGEHRLLNFEDEAIAVSKELKRLGLRQ